MARVTTSGWAMRRSPLTRSSCARPSTGHWNRNQPVWRNCCACWNRTALPFTGEAKPSPSAQRAGIKMSASTGWGTAIRWTICWRFSPARKNIRPASDLPRRPPHQRSICWWTSRQNSRPGKVPGMPAGRRCSTSNRWPRPLTTCPKHGLLDYADLEAKTAEATARYHALSDQIKAAEKRMAEIAVLRTHIVNYAKTRDTYVAYPQGWIFKEIPAGA